MVRKVRGRTGYKQFPGDEEYRKLFDLYLQEKNTRTVDIEDRTPPSLSRIDILKKRIKTFSDPDDYMLVILELFDERDLIPDPGKYYTFVYQAKTPRIVYDEHPLIACLNLHQWGFTGLNFHFEGTEYPKVRNYTWQEVIGQMHIVNNSEIDYMKSVPYRKFRLNS
jgi:hypothetical protein